jgi:hypothetical protein
VCLVPSEIQNILTQVQLRETWTGDEPIGLIHATIAQNRSQDWEGQLILGLRAS